jgi:hypothetical protein
MKIGAALFLLAVGAILRFAIATTVTHGVDLRTVGDILIIIGAVGLILWLIVWAPWSQSRRSSYPPRAAREGPYPPRAAREDPYPPRTARDDTYPPRSARDDTYPRRMARDDTDPPCAPQDEEDRTAVYPTDGRYERY